MAAINRLLAVRGSRPLGSTLRPVGGMQAQPGRLTPRLVITKSPLVTARTRPQLAQPKPKDMGIFRGALKAYKDINMFPITFALMAPEIIAKAGQTAVGVGEQMADALTNVISPTLYESRTEKDMKKGRELGLKGTELLGYSTQRSLPLLSPMFESFPKTAGRLAETGTGGLYNYGEEGIDFYQGLRQGELGNMLLEDIGNVMLAGRVAGLGSVANRAGARLTTAGNKRLGTAVRRTGYFAEQPIAATTRGLARVGSRVAGAGATGRLRLGPARLPQLPARARPLAQSLSTAGQRISTSEMPLRTAVESTQRGFGNFAQTKADQKLANKNLADEDIARTKQAGQEPTERQMETQRQATADFEKWSKWTNNQRDLNKFIRPIQRRMDAVSRTFSQSFARYNEQGAAPGEAKTWRKQEERLRKAAEKQVGEQRQKTLEQADRVGVVARAKESDTTGRFENPTEISESFGAAVLIASRYVDVFKDERAAGKPIDYTIDTITPEDLAVYVEEQGYRITPGAVKKALAYADGLADNIDTVAIEQALDLFKGFSDFMTAQRQAGIGMVRGAGSPLELGLLPVPEFILIELAKNKKMEVEILNVLDEAVIYVLQRDAPQLINELKIDVDKPKGLFEKFANDPNKAGPLYEIAGKAVEEAFDVIRADPDLGKFLENRMIYPAPSRIFMGARQAIIRRETGQDVRALVANLSEFNEASPGLLPKGIVDRISEGIEIAADPTKPFDRESYPKIQKLIDSVIKNIDKQKAALEAEIGTRLDRTDARWARLDDISAVARNAYDMIQTIIDQPELFADQTKVAEVGRLRGVADEAAASADQIDLFLESQRRTLGPVDGPQQVRVRSEIVKDSERLTQERADIETQLNEVNRDIENTQTELAAAEALTPEDIARLEGERDIALELENEIPFTKVDKAEVDRQVAAEINERVAKRRQLKEDFDGIIGKKPRTDGNDLGEDLSSAIYQGLGPGSSKKLFDSFARRFFVPKRDSNPQTRRPGETEPFGYDVVATEIKRSLGLDPIMRVEDAWTELARRWAMDQQIKKELEDLRSPEARQTIAKRIQDEADARVDSELQRSYRELDLLDEAGFTRSSDDYNQIIERAKNLDVLRLRLETLRRQSQEISARISKIGQELAANKRDLDTTSLKNERLRLRGVQQKADAEATTLESAVLKEQKAEVKGRLQGVGTSREFVWGRGVKVTPDGPKLQRQFLDKIDPETERLLKEQETDRAKIQKLREEEIARTESLAEAQVIPEAGGRADAERARPLLAERGGDAPLYIPTGAARPTQLRSVVEKTLRAENLAPESIGGVEKVRTGRILAMTPGQTSARVREILQTFGRNVVIQSIINNKQFVSTVAERVPEAVRERFMQEATITVTNRGRVGYDTKPSNDLVLQEYNKLLFEELKRQGLDPISPVEMPDPNDIYAGREALGALDQIVNANDLTNDTLVMPSGMRSGLASQFEAKDISRGPQWLSSIFDSIRTKTGNWKSIILPFSVRWQVGDLTSNVLNAWIRGDIPPAELYRQMQATSARFQDQTGATRRDIAYGRSLEGYPTDPVSFVLESMGLQGSGLKQADVRSATQGTLIGEPGSKRSRIFPEFRRKSFALNEFQNRLARHSVATKKLIDILDEQGRSIDEITPTSVMSDPVLRDAVESAVNSANDVLGNFSDLTPYERQTVRAIFPFWSWVKFINKAAAELLINQPDRVLFMSHLGSLVMEENAEGMWEWLEGQAEIPGLGFSDVSFLNPYSDAVLFTKNPLAGFFETATNVSPVLNTPLTAVGEAYYGMKGSRLPLVPTLSRPGYLEGRPGETTRTLGDTLGGIGYKFLKDFGGPVRNILDVLPETPNRFTGPAYGLLVNNGRIRGTDVQVGPGPRYGQGSARTEGQFGRQRLSPTTARLSAVARTFGIPGPSISGDVARSIARENVISARRALLRRQRQRRLAQR